MQDDTIQIPNHVDDPAQALLWEVDEVGPIGVGAVAGVLLDAVGWCLLAGLALVYVYRRIKDGNPDGAALHFIYWSGFWPAKAKSFLNPFARRLTP